MKDNTIHIILAVVLLVLLTAVSDPFMLWMPPMAGMLSLLLVAVVMCVWAAFIMKEHAEDEREVLHRMHAGRVAYLSGVTILTVALVVEGLTVHEIDPWIVLALGAMVVSKLAAHLYFEHYK